MRDAGTVPNNVRELDEKLGDKHPDFCLTCVDFGLPYTNENLQAGRWQKESDTYPGDQADWLDMLKKRQQVQTAMGIQAEKWSKYLQNEFSKQLDPGKHTQAGLSKVHKTLLEYQMDGIDGDIAKMQVRVRQLIKEWEAKVEAASDKVKNVTSQKIWHKVLAFLAKGLMRYFDTTQECESTLMDTAEEIKACGGECWFNEEMDRRITKFCKDCGLLAESDCKLACLASWFRLLDELSVMLAFSPMKCLTKFRKTNAFDRMGSGTAGTINTFDVMVELLCDKKSAPYDDGNKQPKPPIVGLLHVFQKRMMMLMERDIVQGFEAVKNSHEGRQAFLEFSKQSGLGEEEMAELKTALKTAIMEYAKRTVDQYINGVKDLETGATIRKSGICVTARPGDAAGEGPLHWLQPFPLHYFNGQLPWRLLRIHPDAEKALADAGGWVADPDDQDDVTDDLIVPRNPNGEDMGRRICESLGSELTRPLPPLNR
ncbi:unnamed protein product [Prorocentrum cordatum]|uniref:RNA-directed RNA polymerase n=1 Tax=Prorocentrum cordatum TaxID=2364126 RepID=A0ABN9VEV6_9DINO|nr:unnamed protein product [Polarella glacialis]